MHEMGIVQSIMEILERQAKLYNAKKIVSVALEFGVLSGVMPSSVAFAFEVLSKGTLADGARLDISIIPIKVFCFECSKEIEIHDYEPFCPMCRAPATKIVQGRDEMRVASMEIE